MNKGSILILSLLMMAILLLIGGVLLSLTLINVSQISIDSKQIKTYWIAHAGLNQTIHDLKDAYFEHQQQLIEMQFGEGKCKIGTLPLQVQGVRQILIVSLGILGDTKESLTGEVKIDSFSDYVLFSDGDIYLNNTGIAKYGPASSLTSWYYFGPVHINGNLYTRITIKTDKPSKIIFAKSKEIRGPALSLGPVSSNSSKRGVFIYYPPNVNTGNLGDVVDSEDVIIVGEADINSNADTFLIGYNDLIWSGRKINFHWKGVDYYPTYTPDVSSTIDFTGEGIFHDKYHSGYYIRMPYASELNINQFSNLLDSKWYIENANFSNSACRPVSFVNDCLAKKEVIGEGKWDGEEGPPYPDSFFEFSCESQNRAIRNVYLVNKNNVPSYDDGTPLVRSVRDSDRSYYAFAPDGVNYEWLCMPVNEYDPTGEIPHYQWVRKYPFWSIQYGKLILNNENTKRYQVNWWFSSFYADAQEWASGRRWIQLGTFIPQINWGFAYDRDIKEVIIGAGLGYGSGESLVLGTMPGVGVDGTIIKSTYKESEEYKEDVFRTKLIIYPKFYTVQSGSEAGPYPYGKKIGNDITFILYNDISAHPLKYDSTYASTEYSHDYPPVDSTSNVLNGSNYPYPHVATGVGYWDVYVKSGAGNYVKKSEGTDYTADRVNCTITFLAVPSVGDTVVINRRHNLNGYPFPIDPESNPKGFVFVKQYPPKQNVKVLIDPLVKAIKIDLSKITKYNAPKDTRYALGFYDYNKNGIQDKKEPSKYGVIYSKIPLVVMGSPGVPVTIVCEDDVYVQSINKNYPLDSPNAYPVGIISRKVIWIDYSGRELNNADTSDREVLLNKVALFGHQDRLFHYGGMSPGYDDLQGSIRGVKYTNKTRLVGSLCLSQINSDGENDACTGISLIVDPQELVKFPFKYYVDRGNEIKYETGLSVVSTLGKDSKPLSYANSFRYNPPSHLPIDFKILPNYKSILPHNVENFFNKLASYTNEDREVIIPVEVYQELINELQK